MTLKQFIENFDYPGSIILFGGKRAVRDNDHVNEYLVGKRNNLAMKGSYIIRDTVMVIGAQGVARVHCALFYDDLQNPKTGGTGHTMNVCKTNDIPVFDQCTWLNWLNEVNV
jgi:hypothetical protein